jgi:transcriptional regulator with XRE-family HTH domain
VRQKEGEKMTELMMKLKGRIVEKGLTQEYLAEKAGMNRSTFTRKTQAGGKDFTVAQFKVIAKELGYTAEEVNSFIMSL